MSPEWTFYSLNQLPGAENWSGRQDSNLRPSAPKADALPDCATPRPPETKGVLTFCQGYGRSRMGERWASSRSLRVPLFQSPECVRQIRACWWALWRLSYNRDVPCVFNRGVRWAISPAPGVPAACTTRRRDRTADERHPQRAAANPPSSPLIRSRDSSPRHRSSPPPRGRQGHRGYPEAADSPAAGSCFPGSWLPSPSDQPAGSRIRADSGRWSEPIGGIAWRSTSRASRTST